LLGLYFFHVKNLAVIENTKKDRLTELALQAIEIGPRAPAEVQGGNGLGSKFEKPKPQPIPAGIGIFVDQTVLLQHHGEPMDGALVELHLPAKIP
jgi:hypothetical protein